MAEKLTVLVVEDEPALLRHVCTQVRRAGDGYAVIGAAEDGRSAIEIAQAQQPDIIISDIRMPGIDGLEVLRQLKNTGFLFEAILMSGYGDFAYAREAMQLGVKEYLLKPVTTQTLIQSLGKSAMSLELARRQFRAELLMEISGRKPLAEQSDCLRYCVLLLHFSRLILPGGIDCGENDFAEILHLKRERVCLLPERAANERLLLVHCDESVSPAAVAGQIFGACGQSEGISVVASTQLYSRAQIGGTAALLRKVAAQRLLPWQCILTFAETPFAPTPVPALSRDEKDQILGCLLSNHEAELRRVYGSAILRRLQANTPRSRFERFLSELLDFSLTARPAVESAEHLAVLRSECIALMEATDAPEDFIDKLFARISPAIFKTQGGNRDGQAIRIRDYLRENYAKEINLAALADQAGIDSAALARTFREICGETPMKYLISLRIDAAKKLIVQRPDLNFRVIGEMTGYPDPFHFSKTFKKLVGLSPSEYRDAAEHPKDEADA